MKKTIATKLQQQLELEGWQEILSNTRKAITMSHPDKDRLVFLGKAGSLRVGIKYSLSFPSDRFKANLLTAYHNHFE